MSGIKAKTVRESLNESNVTILDYLDAVIKHVSILQKIKLKKAENIVEDNIHIVERYYQDGKIPESTAKKILDFIELKNRKNRIRESLNESNVTILDYLDAVIKHVSILQKIKLKKAENIVEDNIHIVERYYQDGKIPESTAKKILDFIELKNRKNRIRES